LGERGVGKGNLPQPPTPLYGTRGRCYALRGGASAVASE
jgi:hypothetical protein